MTFGPYDMMIDFALMSLLLLIAQYMRAKIKIVQNLYLPSSLIAGFLGLFLGPQFLGIIPWASIGSYPYLLVVVLFASLFIGHKNDKKQTPKRIIAEVGDTFFLNMGVEFFQFGAALVVGGALMAIFYPDTYHAFAVLLPAGFVGGHGYAAAIGGALENAPNGFEGAITIGQTFATIGLLTGILGGLVIINIATRVKATRFIKTMAELPESMRTGLVEPEEQTIMGNNTVSPMAIDPLTWHLMLVLIASAGGYYAYAGFKAIAPQLEVPMMCLSMLAGVVLQLCLNQLGLAKYVDKRIITRVGSTVTDYLVSFGVASISISVVMQYMGPILMLLVLGLFLTWFYLFFISRKLFKNFWLERGIFVYGWSTGVVAMGVTLLRIVDPEFRSRTLEDYGVAYVLISMIEIILVTSLPIFIAINRVNVFVAGGLLLAITAVLLGTCAAKYGIQKGKMSDLREGEAEIIEQYKKDKELSETL